MFGIFNSFSCNEDSESDVHYVFWKDKLTISFLKFIKLDFSGPGWIYPGESFPRALEKYKIILCEMSHRCSL